MNASTTPKKRIARTGSYGTRGLYDELIVSARQFFKMSENPGVKIKSAQFIPPILGKSGDFGKFKIKYVR